MWDGRLLKKFPFYSGSQGELWPFELSCIYLALAFSIIWFNKESSMKLQSRFNINSFSFIFIFIVLYVKGHKSTQFRVEPYRCVDFIWEKMSSELRVNSYSGLSLVPNSLAVPEQRSGRENQNSHWEHFHRATSFLCRICQDDPVVVVLSVQRNDEVN